MQTRRWYLRRTASMSPAEINWRLVGKVRAAADRAMRKRRARPRSLEELRLDPATPITKPQALGPHLSAGSLAPPDEYPQPWRDDLRERADDALAHRIDLFHLHRHDLGDTINWNYEYEAQKPTPLAPSSKIDYRDHRSVGDCKLVWEPNRHYHLVVLARAYRITGERAYALEAARQIETWLDQCPYGLGMNWRSGLELGIRLINWVWTLELIRPAGVIGPDLDARIVQAVDQHLAQIEREYSRFSSANNHLIGEAAGVFMAAHYFAGLKKCSRRRERAKRILEREIIRQTAADGGTREQATGYHLFVAWFFLLAAVVAQNADDYFSATFWHQLERMIEFVAALTDGGTALPMIGDADDGYVLDLGGRDDSIASLMCVAAVLFDRPDFKLRAGAFAEAALWLFGPEGRKRFDALAAPSREIALTSRPLPASGCFLLQGGRRGRPDAISAIFDCGPLGYLSIAAHGHADALSLILRVAGADVLVDPGTYDYFTHPAWRRYFRSTAAHNTIAIDGHDQSEMLGPFMWGRRARCRLLSWEPAPGGGSVTGEHDGYTRLSDPVIHRRTVTLNHRSTAENGRSELTVRDELTGTTEHDVTMFWHLAEHCEAKVADGTNVLVTFPGGKLTIALELRLDVELTQGRENPIAGWVSRGYHRKIPAPTITARCRAALPFTLTTRFEIEPATPSKPTRKEALTTGKPA